MKDSDLWEMEKNEMFPMITQVFIFCFERVFKAWYRKEEPSQKHDRIPGLKIQKWVQGYQRG